MARLIIALVCLLSAMQLQADIRLYGEARAGAGGVRHSDLDFYPRFGSFSAGVFIFENIGIEGFVDTSFSSDETDVFEVDITHAAGAAVRLQSPPERGLQAYVLLGFVNFGLKQKENENSVGGRRIIKEDFSGVRVSVGLNQRLEFMKGLIFGIEYRNYYADSGITVDGVSLGLRYEMQ